jgi:hypothetical protein
LYGSETLTYREEPGLSAFESRVLKKIFGLKQEDREEGW